MLSCQNVTWQTQTKQILNDVSIQLHPSERIALIGPNGSGKSSLLKILSSLQKPSSGKLFFLGHELTGDIPLEIRRKMAYVFQEPLLLNTTVFDNVAAGLRIRGVSRKEIIQRVQHWLERFHVSHLTRRSAKTLSGGEAQRVSLARAFVLEPDVLFLDEPFSALDAPTKEALLLDLQNVFATSAVSAVIVSHDYREVTRLASRVIMLQNGRLIATGTPQELLDSKSTDVAEFLRLWKTI